MNLTIAPSERVPRGANRRNEPSRHAAPALYRPGYRSEAFAEDLVEPMHTLQIHAPRRRRRATLLFVVPLGAAFLGSVLPLLNQIA